jgi:hypothetical protein
MEKYGVMAGTQEASKSNPSVRSKFDKSHGKGLPAPHLKHPGETAKPTGTKMPGHTENGHKLPVERGLSKGSHLHHGYTPGEMGAPIITGTGQGHPKNSKLTDGDVVKSSKRVDHGGSFLAGSDDRPRGGSDKHVKQHATGRGQESAKSSRPQHKANHSRSNREGAGVLSGGKLR